MGGRVEKHEGVRPKLSPELRLSRRDSITCAGQKRHRNRPFRMLIKRVDEVLILLGKRASEDDDSTTVIFETTEHVGQVLVLADRAHYVPGLALRYGQRPRSGFTRYLSTELLK